MKQKYDNHYRYPGSRPFSDSDLDRRLFFGRDEEINYLFHSILVENLFVLFSKSGMGKTSLLNAGLMEMLRLGGFLPLVIRFNDREISPLDRIFPSIEEAVKRRNEQLVEQYSIDYEPGEKDSLWQYFKTVSFWSVEDIRLTPVLVFDQFEEFFTLHSQEDRELFINQLADLIRNCVPKTLRDSYKSDNYFPYSDTAPAVKIIISIREDYLGHLEELTHAIPNILKNRFRLLPLNCQNARDAILKPAQLAEDEFVRSKRFSYAAETVAEMLDFLCQQRERGQTIKTNEVEPFQLQLLCHHIEEKVSEKVGKKPGEYVVQKRELGGKAGMKRILQGFYEARINALGSAWKKRRVRKLCEKGFIEHNFRVSQEEERIRRKYKVSRETLSQLVDSRLLRSEPRLGSVYYELSHDTLVQPILKSSQWRKIKKASIGIPLLIFALIVTAAAVTKQVIKYVDIDRLYEEASTLTQLGNYKEAINRYYSIMNIEGSRVIPYIEIGELSQRLEDPDEAIRIYEKAIKNKIKIKHEILYYQIARIYECSRRVPSRAVEYYKKALEANPALTEAYVALGDIYRNQRRFDEAIQEYNEALKYDDKKVEAYKGLALTYIGQGDADEAVKIYHRAVKTCPGCAFIYRTMAENMKREGMESECERLYQVASKVDCKEAGHCEELGNDFYDLEKYERAIEFYKKALELNKKREDTYKKLALAYINQGEPEKALEVYRSALDISVDYAYIYREISWIFEKKKMHGELGKLYQIASNVDSKEAAYYEGLADDFNTLKRYDKAIEFYKKALEFDDKNVPAYKKLMLAYLDQGETDKAVEIYRSTLEISTDIIDIYRRIAGEMKNKGDEKAFNELYQAVISVDTKEAAYFEKIAAALVDLEEFDRAIGNYNTALMLGSKKESTYKDLAMVHIKRGEPGKAAEVYRRAAAVSLDFADMYKDLGQEIAKSGTAGELLKLYQAAAEVNSKEAAYYERLAALFTDLKDYDRAIETYKKALKLDNKKKAIYKNLAVVYIKRGEPEKAISVYRQAVGINIDCAYIYNDISQEIMKRGMGGELLKLYQAAAEVNSMNAEYYTQLGTELVQLEKYDRAIEIYKKALWADNHYDAAYFGLGFALERQGQHNEAVQNYQKALEINPANIVAETNLAGLEFMRRNFPGASVLARQVLENQNISAENKLMMRFILISSLIFQGEKGKAYVEVANFIKFYRSIPGSVNKSGRNYQVIKEFIGKDKKLRFEEKRLVLVLINILESPQKVGDELLEKCREITKKILKT